MTQSVMRPDLQPIQVWRFKDAPKQFKDLSPFGGDEDWVALVPPHLAGMCIDWLDYLSGPGTDTKNIKLDDGFEVVISAHA